MTPEDKSRFIFCFGFATGVLSTPENRAEFAAMVASGEINGVFLRMQRNYLDEIIERTSLIPPP
jgi:hypothetical protein